MGLFFMGKSKKDNKFKETEIDELPEDWDVKTISEVCNISLGGTPKTEIEEFWNGKIKWASARDVANCKSRYVTLTERTITEKGVENSNAKIHPKNTIIITSRGTVGAIALLPEPMAFNQTCYGLQSKKEHDVMYVYYVLKDSINRLKSLSYGTVFETITIKTFNEIKIPLPPLPEQRAIAKILSDLDSKIELNQQMNRTLEAIGQAIFKHWFVDFEFPNEEGKPYKSSGGEMVYNKELGKEIPKGWRVGKLGDYITQIESGSRPKGGSTDSGIPSIGAENILGLGHYDYSSTKYVPLAFYENMTQGKIKDFDVLLYKDGAQLGRTSIFGLGFPFKECCINEHVFIVRVKSPLTQIYLYFWSTLPFVKDSIINLNTNSAQPGITKEGVKGLDILVPKEEITKKFETIVKQLVIKVFKNCLESQTLSSIRDSLLPKLMSGKIRVPVEVK